ncbi:hypothetical protein CRP804_gp33 [Roseobacter phage CRP-804]|uniref:Internal virion protein n=1 Tax=Roseobacter phage CRP-804 TaxID=3072850 RepID=A0AAX3ZWN7_9CAUD|nr:hypothetical protein CRP804_gp33 [Roseobacter phage CRP-804]
MAPRNNRLNPDIPTRGTAQNLVQVLDTYYRPARDVMGERAIAEGFNSISNFLGKQAAVEKEQELKEITMQAQRDAMAGLDPDEEFSQIRKGLLFRSQSRAYNQAYNETMGTQAAIEFRDNLALEYEQSGLDRNTDPQAFREWMNERVNTFLTENADNEYFVAGAMPYMQQTISNMSSAHTSNITRTMEENRIAAMRRQADDIAMRYYRGEISNEELVAQLQGVGTAYYETGENGSRVRLELMSSLLDVANATNSTEILDIIGGAFSEGSLQLTPSQLAALDDARDSITRDIEYRRGLAAQAEERVFQQQERSVTDAVTDFYLNPENLAVSPEVFISGNSDMAEMIRNSPRSRELLDAVRTAHQSVTNVTNSLSPEAELMNNVMITDAFRNGEIQTAGDIVSYLQEQRANGVGFSENNISHAFSELSTYNDPEGVYGTEAYKNFSRITERGVITALVAEPQFSFQGDTTDAQSLAVQGIYRQFEAERLAALPIQSRRDPRAIREALDQAAQDTHDYYRQTDPEFYNERQDQYAREVASGSIPDFSNPQFERSIADANAAFDAAVEEGSAILFPEGNTPAPEVVDPIPAEQDTSQVDPIEPEVPEIDYREYASVFADFQDYLNDLPRGDRLEINDRYVEWFDALSESQQQAIADQYRRSTGSDRFTARMVRDRIRGRGYYTDWNIRELADRAFNAEIYLPDPSDFLSLD